jgi:hypothetical protein
LYWLGGAKSSLRLNLAHYQEVRLDLKHPNGGKAMYQEETLYANASDYLQTIADQVLSGGVDEAMADVMEKFANDSGAACPKELTLLAHSDHPTVTSNGALVYDRAPEVPRLSEQELRSLHSVRASHRRG